MEIGKMRLKDILESENKSLLTEYLEYVEFYLNSPLMRRKTDVFIQIKKTLKNSDIGYIESYSLNDLQAMVDKIEYDNTSLKLFSGHHVVLYPTLIEKISNIDRKCDFSANLIKKGNYYTHYSFLLDDLNSKNRYALLNSINIQSEYEYLLPRTIHELEEFNDKLENSYKNDDELFYNISSNLKSDGLKIRKLSNKKHKIIY